MCRFQLSCDSGNGGRRRGSSRSVEETELSGDERETFLYDLRLSLHDRNIGHRVEFSPEAPDDPVSVAIGSNLIEEQATRTGWFERNHMVQNGASLVALMFQRMAHRQCWP